MNERDHDPSLVKFTQFAYNQEQYIFEAFEGTFPRFVNY